jgi:hypothetical protein
LDGEYAVIADDHNSLTVPVTVAAAHPGAPVTVAAAPLAPVVGPEIPDTTVRVGGISNQCAVGSECTLIRDECNEPIAVPRKEVRQMKRLPKVHAGCDPGEVPPAVAECVEGHCQARYVHTKN